MTAELTAAEREALAAGWPDFWKVHAATQAILAAHTADLRAKLAAVEVRLAEVKAANDATEHGEECGALMGDRCDCGKGDVDAVLSRPL